MLHRLHALLHMLRPHSALILFVVCGIFFLVFLRINKEAYRYGQYEGDEYHTVKQGIAFLVHGNVENFRAQETTRWLVRLFYPLALISMNTHMGGNVYENGWSYPGHQYVVRNFIDHSDFRVNPISQDSNLRDFLHALRVYYIIFVAICVLALLFFLFQKGYYLTAFGSLLLLGINTETLAEQQLFYIEPAGIAFLSLFLLAYLWHLWQSSMSWKGAVAFGVLGAIMVSTKFSLAPFLLLPLFLLWSFRKQQSSCGRWILTYCSSFLLGYLVVNFPAFTSLAHFNLFLHDLTSNFWQYSTGSSPDVTTAAGLPHLFLILRQLEGLFGYLLYLLPLCILFGYSAASTRDRHIIVSLSVLVLLILYSFTAQSVYIPRNLILLYPAMLLLGLLSIEIATRSFAREHPRKVYFSVAILCVLLVSGFVTHNQGVRHSVASVFPSLRGGFLEQVRAVAAEDKGDERWYAIGFAAGNFTQESFTHRLTFDSNVQSILTSSNYKEFEKHYESIATSSRIMVVRRGNNKHLTNYVLPKRFTTQVQFGEYYLFYNRL